MSSITIPENGQILACGRRWRTDALFKPSVRYADGSEIFFVCPFGGTVLDYLRQHGCPVYVTFYH